MSTLSKVANPAARLLLTKIGKEYDKKRTFPVFENKRDSPIILSHFNDQCVYCGITLCLTNNAPNKMVKDHLIPINVTTFGLHAWGNIVPACNDCNSERLDTHWRVFLKSKTKTQTEYNQREAKLMSYYTVDYPYSPNTTAIKIAVELVHSLTRSYVDNLCQVTVNCIKHTI